MRPIEEIAREAGLRLYGIDDLVRFAVIVRAEALEEAAAQCEDKGPELLRWWGDGPANAACQECATAIRALKDAPHA